MQVVIEIPEEMYKWVNDANKLYNDYGTSDFVELIKNGTLLPKEHGDLIDRSELKPDCDWNDYYDYFQGYSCGQVDDANVVIPGNGRRKE